jgi:hypothetical protein
VHFLLKSYAIFTATIAAVQTAKRSLGMEIFEHLKVGFLLRVEYQSCAEFYNNHARQNSTFFCIRDERTTEFSVSVGQLPKQLGNFAQIAFFGHVKGKIRREVESQL